MEKHDSVPGTRRVLGDGLDFIVRMNPWSWIAAVFFLHSIGSLLVVRLFVLDYREVAVPIFTVVLGGILSLAFRWFDRSRKMGAWKWWLPVVMYALFIFALSSAVYHPGETPCSTKDFHFVEYSVLGLLLCVAWCSAFTVKGWTALAARVLPLGILYAASDEFHQSFVPGRTAAFADVLLDTASLCVGMAVFIAVRHAVSRIDASDRTGT